MPGPLAILLSPSTIHSMGTELVQQIYLAGTALLASIVVAVPVGIFLSRLPRWASGVMHLVSVFQTIPSIALLAFMIPVVGVGALPAIIALFIYALLPIIGSTYAGLRMVEQSIVSAARGMGMTSWQILWSIEIPLSIGGLASGIRTSAVLIIGWATLGAFIGAGGLGQLIFEGFSIESSGYVIAGAVPVTVLAIVVDILLGKVEIRLTPRAMRLGDEGGN